MDLSLKVIHDVVHPTGAFSHVDNNINDGISGPAGDGGDGTEGDDRDGWAWSQLNPKNRIDSLTPMAKPLWRIDGCAGLGTQFYAYPLFLEGHSPMHIDIFVRDASSYSPALSVLLDIGKSFHTKDAIRLRRLGIAQHILRILQWHTVKEDGVLRPSAIRNLYENGPYGSRIVIEGISCHVHTSRIVISPNYPLESDLTSYQELIKMWDLAEDNTLPPEVSIDKVHLVRQLHDSISEVYVDNVDHSHESIESSGHPAESEHRTVILKSLSSGVKYMYQEIRALLKDIPRHNYILSRPLHIVTKKCLFGGKRGVIGFTMPLLKAGSLRDALPLLKIHGNLHMADQLRWARQITEAMCHVWHQGHSFYPDLRLDNVVLTTPAPEGDAGLVDFEQRGVWSSFSAPEVDYIENIRLVAFDDQNDYDLPEEVSSNFKQKLVRCYEAAMGEEAEMPKGPTGKTRKRSLILRLEDEVKYSNPALSYNVSWSCLTKSEQEAAMVYMLGRLLWCIFEGMSAPHHGAVWQSYPREPELEFPAFCLSTPEQQDLVMKCFGTTGAKEQSKFIQLQSKLYMKQEVTGSSSGASYELVSTDIQARAREYWTEKLKEGDEWLEKRNKELEKAAAGDNFSGDGSTGAVGETERTSAGQTPDISAHGRPTLNWVLERIRELEART